MRYIFGFFAVAAFSLVSCDKYMSLKGDITVSGQVALAIPKTAAPLQPLANTDVYLNNGSDSTTYIFQVLSDSTGKYTVPLLKKGDDYTLFTRFSKGNVSYLGVAHFKADGNAVVDLTVSPAYTNGLVISLVDSLGGRATKVRVRLYTSKLAAIADYAASAVIDANTDAVGQLARFNLSAMTYYIVVKDSIGSFKFNTLDSITVANADIAEKKVILRY